MLGQFQDRWITGMLENCRYCRQQESLRLLRKQTRTFPRLSFASTGANMCRPSTYTNLHNAGHCICPQIKFHVADVPNFAAVCGSDFIDLHDLVYALFFWCPGETCDSISMVTNGNEHLKALEHEHTLTKTSPKRSHMIYIYTHINRR